MTPLLNDLLGTIASVAIEKAKSNGVALVQRELSTVFCATLTFENLRRSTTGLLHKALTDAFPLATGPVLQRTCDAIKVVRLEELAASSKPLERAVGADVTALTLKALTQLGVAKSQPEVAAVVNLMEGTIVSLMDGRTVTSEREVQLMLLQLGQLGLSRPGEPAEWRDVLEVGMTVLVECSRRGTCTADQFRSMLDREVAQAQIAAQMKSWPGLPQILLRAVDVLRPPAGASPRATAKTALNIVLDVMDHVENDPSAVKVLRSFRILANSVLDEDFSQAAVAGASTLAAVLTENCEASKKCVVEIKTEQLQRAFGLLGALVSYASSYRDEKLTGDAQKDAAALQQRADERKKAMESLVASATDRTKRGNNWIVGVGVGVAVGIVSTNPRGSEGFTAPGLSLPGGISIQYLPNDFESFNSAWGFHTQVTVIDLAQYAAFQGTNGKTPTPDAGSALFFGANIGVLFGTPSVPVFAGVQGGYAPTLNWDSSTRGSARAGLLVGTHVPFWDFN